jgi:hypothetical protein
MTKTELVQQAYNDMSDQDRRKFDRWLRANVAIASLFSAALLAMALANGPYSVGPRIATAESNRADASPIERFRGIDSEVLSGEDVTRSVLLAGTTGHQFPVAGRAFAKECAARDLQAITDIEDYGNAGTVPSEKLAAAYAMVLDARGQCRLSEAEGLRVYGAIDLTVTQAAAK